MKVFARESCDVDGVHYRVFHWTIDFCEENDLAVVPVWVFLPCLPSNYYYEAFLRNIVSLSGKFLHQDNCMKCAVRTNGARVCVKIDASSDPFLVFWIGIPQNPNSWHQEVMYETLPAYCWRCKVQGHSLNNCKGERKKIKDDQHVQDAGQ